MLLYFLPQLFFFTTQNNPHFVTATALVGTIVAVVAALVSTAAGSSFSTERIYPYVKCQNGRTYNIQHPK